MLMQHVLYYAIIMETARASYPRSHLSITATQQGSRRPLQPASVQVQEKTVNVRGQPLATQPYWASCPLFSHKTTVITFHRYSPRYLPNPVGLW